MMMKMMTVYPQYAIHLTVSGLPDRLVVMDGIPITVHSAGV